MTLSYDRASFPELVYLEAFRDVRVAVAARAFASGFDHFVRYGSEEIRTGNRPDPFSPGRQSAAIPQFWVGPPLDLSTPLIGRENQLKYLNQLAAERGVHVIAVTGKPGAGKTLLVQRWLMRDGNHTRSRNSIFFWDFSTNSDEMEFLRALQAFAIELNGGNQFKMQSRLEPAIELVKAAQASVLVLDRIDTLQGPDGGLRAQWIKRLLEQVIRSEYRGLVITTSSIPISELKGAVGFREIMLDDVSEEGILAMSHPSPDFEPISLEFNAPTEPVPAQGAGPHFYIGDTGRIVLAKTSSLDDAGNDARRIQQLLPLVRESAEDLVERLRSNANAFPELVRDASRYRDTILPPSPEIAWGLLWGLGVRLEEGAVAAERRIAGRFAPDLEDTALAALQALRTLHAPLILATAEGRELQEQADQLSMTRSEQTMLRSHATALSANLDRSEEVIEKEAAATVTDATSGIGDGRHPERGTTFGIVTVRNLTIMLVGAAIVAAPAHYVGGILGIGITMAAWEGLKKSPIIAAAAATIGLSFDRALEASDTAIQDRVTRLAPFRDFVIANEQHLRQIAESTPQLRWVLAYLDYIIRTDKSHRTLP